MIIISINKKHIRIKISLFYIIIYLLCALRVYINNFHFLIHNSILIQFDFGLASSKPELNYSISIQFSHFQFCFFIQFKILRINPDKFSPFRLITFRIDFKAVSEPSSRDKKPFIFIYKTSDRISLRMSPIKRQRERNAVFFTHIFSWKKLHPLHFQQRPLNNNNKKNNIPKPITTTPSHLDQITQNKSSPSTSLCQFVEHPECKCQL